MVDGDEFSRALDALHLLTVQRDTARKLAEHNRVVAEEAQAQAAAMRESLERLRHNHCEIRESSDPDEPQTCAAYRPVYKERCARAPEGYPHAAEWAPCRICEIVEPALAPDAGRELLERLRRAERGMDPEMVKAMLAERDALKARVAELEGEARRNRVRDVKMGVNVSLGKRCRALEDRLEDVRGLASEDPPSGADCRDALMAIRVLCSVPLDPGAVEAPAPVAEEFPGCTRYMPDPSGRPPRPALTPLLAAAAHAAGWKAPEMVEKVRETAVAITMSPDRGTSVLDLARGILALLDAPTAGEVPRE